MKDLDAYINSGATYFDKGNYDHAISDFDQAIQINPNLSEAYYNRSLAFSINGSITEAITDLNKTIDFCGSNAQLCEAAQSKLKELGGK